MSWLLRKAARYCGLRLDYVDARKRLQILPDRVLLDLIAVITGQNSFKDKDLSDIIRQRRRWVWSRGLRPVHVIKARSFHLHLYLNSQEREQDMTFEIHGEDNQPHPLTWKVVSHRDSHEGRRLHLKLQAEINYGYYDLKVFCRNELKSSSFLIFPPERGFQEDRKVWGAFTPLYAVRTKKDWGIGDTASLGRLQTLLRTWGGDFIGSLPLLPLAYEAEPFDPSPYSAVSKLFWNEIYLDMELLGISRESHRAVLEELNRLSQVDYQAVYQLKKSVLSELAEEFFFQGKDLSPEFQRFLTRYPEASTYADFAEQNSQASRNYHLYVQFQMDRQLGDLALKAQGVPLYLDYPVGCNPKGFDMYHFKDAFLKEVTVGAPPDLLYPQGQNWNFAPLDPARIRERRYDYFIKTLRHHMQYAGYLRIDHVMSFQRLYVIPEGKSAQEGGYIQYRPEEFFAILALESHKHRTQVIGENLGTVPASLQHQMKDGGYLGMWVFIFDAGTKPTRSIKKIKPLSLACLNTHDLIPFEGYIKGQDLVLQERLHILEEEDMHKQISKREHLIQEWCKDLHVPAARDLQGQILERLAQSEVQMVLVNLEDLWGEQNPQNIPGTSREYPNWRKRWPQPLEDVEGNEHLTKQMKKLSRHRRGESYV